MREVSVEDYLREQTVLQGALIEKFTTPGRRGPPDDLVTWPWGEMDLVETKAPTTGRRSALQKFDHKQRAMRGVPVYLIDTKEKVDQYVRIRCSGSHPHIGSLFSMPVRLGDFRPYAEGQPCNPGFGGLT